MREIIATGSFKRDQKRCKKRGKNLRKLTEIITLLESGEALPLRYKDHKLTGNFIGRRECHLEPDWLLIYKPEGDTVILEATGTHSDLFT